MMATRHSQDADNFFGFAPEAAEYTQEESGDFGSQHNLQDAEADYDAQQQYAIEVRNALRLPELAAPKPDVTVQRRVKNKRSAALSRLRKKEYITNLESTIGFLSGETQRLQLEIDTLSVQATQQQRQIEHLEAEILSLLTLRNSGWEERNT